MIHLTRVTFGGGGTLFWPLSCAGFSNWLPRLSGEYELFQRAVECKWVALTCSLKHPVSNGCSIFNLFLFMQVAGVKY